ncbi:MAG TPA: ethylbenzene dehydrogenase-related protein [Burkholderiales bacterium]|nr:ethylbenzene dehydrogenase-related protein [Burkholderiales bacterium]
MRSFFAARPVMLALCALAQGAAAAPDWEKVPAKTITVFYPGVASLEWALGRGHGGARGTRKGERCTECHHEEAADLGRRIVSGEKAGLEPDPAAVKGKAPAIAATVQAAYDAANFHLRLRWTQPAPGQGKKMDQKSAVKLAVMLGEAGKLEFATAAGCWAACHHDLRSMPDVDPAAPQHPRAKELDIRANGPTKYLKESRTALELLAKPLGGWDKLKPQEEIAALLKDGRFLEMWQFRSGEGPREGYVLEARRLKAAPGLAAGRLEGGVWTVTFTRGLAGGPGRHELAPGRLYTVGIAIHDDHSDYRFHHVSLGYTLALDNPRADIVAVRQ